MDKVVAVLILFFIMILSARVIIQYNRPPVCLSFGRLIMGGGGGVVNYGHCCPGLPGVQPPWFTGYTTFLVTTFLVYQPQLSWFNGHNCPGLPGIYLS